MKLLLSAYACEPSKGSEPGVGWNWAQALFRRGYDVHVITRSNNRRDIESAYKGQSPPITFYYYDLPKMGSILEALAWGNLSLLFGVADRRLPTCETTPFKREIQLRSAHNVCLIPSTFLHGRTGHSFHLWARRRRGDNAPSQFRKSIPLRSQLVEVGRNLGSSLVSAGPDNVAHLLSRSQDCLCHG